MARQYQSGTGLLINVTATRQYQSGTGAFANASDGAAAGGGGGGASVTATAAWTEGAEVVVATASSSSTSGTLTTAVFRNNTGSPRASVGNCTLNVYNATTGALVLRATGLTTNSAGRLSVTNPAIVSGTTYAYEGDFSAASMGRRLPVGVAA